MSNISSSAFADTKAHYDLLDGLRGVAALMVIWYHVFEGYAFAGGGNIETLNHGYLAVDFFFILSGFVIGYAYDDRWGKSLTMKDFFKRRLIRLHPMVIMGAVVGAITFYIQGSVQWDGTHIALSMIMLSLLCTIFFIPAMPGAGYEGITDFVLDQMTSYGLNACPPLLVGVGVGTSIETAALNSKKALMRPIGSHNDNANAAKMEQLLEDGINKIGLGPQGMGGKYSVMGVNIENTARHPSTIGVAVNVGCWSHRRGHIVVNPDLTVTCDTHSTWKFNA